MKKILLLLLAVLLIAFTGCKNAFGTSTDTGEYTAALAKNAYQSGAQPITVTTVTPVVTAGSGEVTITFNQAYDRNSITAANGAIQVYNYVQTATNTVPAGTLGTAKVLDDIEYASDKTVIARFDAAPDTANGYLVYLDATVITFLNGAYRLNGNGNQIGGEPDDSYLYNGALTSRALVFPAAYAATGNASVSEDGTLTPFNIGSQSLVVAVSLPYKPNGVDVIQIQVFDYVSATWKTVSSTKEVITRTSVTPNTYYVVASDLPAAKEKDRYRVYIPQPAAITYAVPGAGPGTGTAVGKWNQGFSSTAVSPSTGTKTAYVPLSTITGSTLTFSVVNYEVNNAYLKVLINATSVPNHGAVKAVQDELFAGYANGKVKFFSAAGNSQNIAYQLDTVGSPVAVSSTESYVLYRITNLVYGANGAAGNPDIYVENGFTLSSKGLLPDSGYEASLHPFADPDSSTTPFMKNWTQVTP